MSMQIPDFGEYGYTVCSIIGTGHYGSVYAVERLHEPRHMLVCKLVNLDSLPPKDKRLAEQEVGILRSLNHKNIVRFYDYFEVKDSNWLGVVMEYCDQGDMRHVLKERSKSKIFIPEEQVMCWFTQIADALRFIHAHRVIHRDLKTSNIFLKGPFPHTCLVGDFGISRILEETLAAAQTVIGTPYYLSPELCKREPYSYKSDIWSLGICLYEMFTFKIAFRGSNLFNLVSRIIKEPFESVHVYNPHVSAEALLLIDRLLAKDPQGRPSAAELMREQFVRSFIPKNALPPAPVLQSISPISVPDVPSIVSPTLRRRIPIMHKQEDEPIMENIEFVENSREPPILIPSLAISEPTAPILLLPKNDNLPCIVRPPPLP